MFGRDVFDYIMVMKKEFEEEDELRMKMLEMVKKIVRVDVRYGQGVLWYYDPDLMRGGGVASWEEPIAAWGTGWFDWVMGPV